VNIKYNSLTKSLGRKIGAFVRSVICHGEDHGVAIVAIISPVQISMSVDCILSERAASWL